MAGNLKSDIINGAFSILRISGLTVIPGSEDNELALTTLEEMAAEFEGNNIYVAYNFETSPDINSASGIEPQYRKSFKTLLAERMLSDYGKGAQPDPILLKDASYSYSFLSSRTAQVKKVDHPRTMARGSGNRWNQYWRRYYHPSEVAPISAETNKMIIGDINDFEEDFTTYLKGTEDITSYELTVDTGLLVESHSASSSVISYRIQAVGSNNENPSTFYQVKIVVTTDSGRVVTRMIDFSLTAESTIIGGGGGSSSVLVFQSDTQEAIQNQTVFTTDFNINNVYVDNVIRTPDEYSGQGTSTITFNIGLDAGQQVYMTSL